MIWKRGASGRNSPRPTRPSVRAEIEAKPVDVHLRDPVAERVDDQARGLRVRRLDAVAGAGEVEVVARVRHQPVVGRVVDPAQAERRPEVVAFGGVVVDDVEDHFDARRVEGFDHRLELGDLGAGRAGGHVAVALLGREEGERAVAPVVAEVAVGEEAVVGGFVDGEELDRRDAERGEVLDDGGVREAGVGAAELGREIGVELGQAADVGLVDDGACATGCRGARRRPSRRRRRRRRTWARRGRCRADRWRRSVVVGGGAAGRPGGTRTWAGSNRPHPRGLWRRDRRAACADCSGARARARRARGRESRRARRARSRGRSRAR